MPNPLESAAQAFAKLPAWAKIVVPVAGAGLVYWIYKGGLSGLSLGSGTVTATGAGPAAGGGTVAAGSSYGSIVSGSPVTGSLSSSPAPGTTTTGGSSTTTTTLGESGGSTSTPTTTTTTTQNPSTSVWVGTGASEIVQTYPGHPGLSSVGDTLKAQSQPLVRSTAATQAQSPSAFRIVPQAKPITGPLISAGPELVAVPTFHQPALQVTPSQPSKSNFKVVRGGRAIAGPIISAGPVLTAIPTYHSTPVSTPKAGRAPAPKVSAPPQVTHAPAISK